MSLISTDYTFDKLPALCWIVLNNYSKICRVAFFSSQFCPTDPILNITKTLALILTQN